jgi:transcription initiation factor IIE alpha subunit
MLSILEYLCLYSTKTPVSKYHIMTKINAIRQQRPNRINQILNALEENDTSNQQMMIYLIQNFIL